MKEYREYIGLWKREGRKAERGRKGEGGEERGREGKEVPAQGTVIKG